LAADYAHQVVDHAVQYVDGRVHTNGLENFWSLLKRSISRTYVSVEPFHLFRYLDEQGFRYNERKSTDAERFVTAMKKQGVGRAFALAKSFQKTETSFSHSAIPAVLPLSPECSWIARTRSLLSQKATSTS
jgi:ISXO2-like transposase domain